MFHVNRINDLEAFLFQDTGGTISGLDRKGPNGESWKSGNQSTW